MLKPLISTCLLAAALAGCGSVSPLGLAAASRLDPLETAPGDIAVVLSVPDALQLQTGDAHLMLGFVPVSADAAAPIATTVPLTVTRGAAGPRASRPDETLFVFGIDPEAATQIAATQARIKALRAQGVEGQGTLRIGINGGCLTRPLDGRVPVATWLQTGAGSGFVPLTRSTDLYAILSLEERPQLPSC